MAARLARLPVTSGRREMIGGSWENRRSAGRIVGEIRLSFILEMNPADAADSFGDALTYQLPDFPALLGRQKQPYGCTNGHTHHEAGHHALSRIHVHFSSPPLM